jgi:signal transduction histidine kinase
MLPNFCGTPWPAIACVLAGAMLAWLGLTRRVRSLTRKACVRAETRADERILAAQEVHDTLLQGLQGLLLNFHVASQAMSQNDPSRAMLERALSTADRLILEGRIRVGSLPSMDEADPMSFESSRMPAKPELGE